MPALIEPPTPAELRAFMASHNLTREQFAAHLGVTVDTVYKWLAGKRTPKTSLWRTLRDLERELTGEAP